MAGGVAGLGAAEVARRELSDAQIRELLNAEIDERLTAARAVTAGGHTERAATLRSEAAVLSDLLGRCLTAVPGWASCSSLTSPPRRPRSARPPRGWPRSPASPTCCAGAGAEDDPKLVAVVVSWLSGELPQRQIGVGWAALRSLPPRRTEPSLTVLQVDAAFSEIGAGRREGFAGAARRTRQRTVRRSHRARADIPAPPARRRAAPGRTGRRDGRRGREGRGRRRAGGAARGDAGRRPARRRGRRADRRRGGARPVHAQGRPAGGPDARPDRDRCRRGARTPRRHSGFRGQAGRRAGADPPRRRRGVDLHPQPRRRHRTAAGGGRGDAGAAGDRPDRRRARRSPCVPTDVRTGSR